MKKNESKNQESEDLIDKAAETFARLFLDQVLWQREEKNKKTDN